MSIRQTFCTNDHNHVENLPEAGVSITYPEGVFFYNSRRSRPFNPEHPFGSTKQTEYIYCFSDRFRDIEKFKSVDIEFISGGSWFICISGTILYGKLNSLISPLSLITKLDPLVYMSTNLDIVKTFSRADDICQKFHIAQLESVSSPK